MKMTKGLLKILVIQIIISSFSLSGYALEKPTHFVINEYIAIHEIGGFSFDEYLKEQLGFQDGVNTIIEHPIITIIHKEPTTVFRWLGYGGEKEDEPFLGRFIRHFHNPLETWDEAGCGAHLNHQSYGGKGQINGRGVIIPEFSNSNCRNG